MLYHYCSGGLLPSPLHASPAAAMSCPLLPLLVLLILSLPAISSAQYYSSSPHYAVQYQALLSLRRHWHDPFNHLADWADESTSFCTWTGISCNNDSSIFSLSLSRFQLSGSLSPSIGNFSGLQSLYLSGNAFNGSIPPQIGRLANLTTLDLSFNSFSGALPVDSFSNLTMLQDLNLESNQLTGPVPPQLFSLPSLKSLRLRHNFFNGSITLSGASGSLRFLLVENNSFSGELPANIGELRNLLYLAAAYNSFTGAIPSGMGSLTRLSAIYLGYNKLNGSIPQEMGNLGRLLYLHLQDNNLQGGIPSSIGSLSSLRELILSNNDLEGPLPDQLGQLNSTTTLDLSFNRLNGSISPSLGNMSSLTNFNLSYNNLSGEVPTNGVLSHFSALSFVGNGFLCGGPLVDLKCAAPAPSPAPAIGNGRQQEGSSSSSSGLSRKGKIIIGAVVGGVGLLFLMALLIIVVTRRPAPRREPAVPVPSRYSPDLTDNLRKAKLEMYVRNFKFSYQEIVSHAGYYDTAHVVGKGRFATVYRSDLPGGTRLAVKVFNNPISQPVFEREIAALEQAAGGGHVSTLLPIRGYYSNPAEKVIFYDYMPSGTLYELLHGRGPGGDVEPLDWARRLRIGVGVAQAVAHLHRGAAARVLHKDLKSSNVLVGEDTSPVVADYGLVGMVTGGKLWVETPGYTPPELRATRRYTEKTDVYCFGVVLLELLTRKKPVSYIGERELSLVNWVTRLQRDGRGREVLDGQAVQTCPFPDYPDRALQLAILCLSEQPGQRPSLSEVVSILEGLQVGPSASSSPLRSPGPDDRPLLA